MAAPPIPPTLLSSLAKLVGGPLARRLLQYARGSEVAQLVELLKTEHPAAVRIRTQPAVLLELWRYSTTGELRERELLDALRAITRDDDECGRLAEAIRTTQWRVVPDVRRQHFELQRLQHELRHERADEQTVLLAGIVEALDRTLARTRPQLAVARSLPAEADRFVDRVRDLDRARACLADDDGGELAGARVLGCNGMPGVGSSAFALHLAHGHADAFPGGVLYADFRRADAVRRPPAEVAVQLLRDLGVAADAIPPEDESRLATLRSLLAETPVLLLLDNVGDEQDVRPLIPPNHASVVLATSTARLAGIGAAELVSLDPLADADALDLLRSRLRERVEREPDAAQAIVQACEGLPLALSIAAAKLRRQPGLTLAAYAERLADEHARLGHLADRERTLGASFATSVRSLPATERRLLLLLAALDVSAIEPRLCAALLDVPEAAAATALERLEEEALLMPGPDGVRRMHRLLRLWGREQAGRELDGALVASAQERRVGCLEGSSKARSPDQPTED